MYPQLYLARPGIAAIDATIKAVAAVTSPIGSVLEFIYPSTQKLYSQVIPSLTEASRDSAYTGVQEGQQEDLIALQKAEEGLLEKLSPLSYLSPLQVRSEQPWLPKWLVIWICHPFVV
jgi:hypothetical protein